MIKEYLNKVFLRDIMQLLKELPDKSVDMVYGDGLPPVLVPVVMRVSHTYSPCLE